MEQWDKNYYITSVAGASNGSSVVVMSKGLIVSCIVFIGFSLPLAFAASIDFVHSPWLFFICNLRSYYCFCLVEGSEFLKASMYNDSKFSDLCFDLISAGTRYTQQSYKVSESFPYKWINKKWKEGFHVTSMGTAGSRWGIVMSRNAGFSDQVCCCWFVLFSATILHFLSSSLTF